MKKHLMLSAMLIAGASAFAQSVGVNTNTPDPSAALHVEGTDKGILIPRMTANERQAIASPATGLMVFQTDGTSGFYYFSGLNWTMLGANGPAGATGAQGVPGPVGPQGPRGLQGVAGNDGAQGPAGPQGVAGNDGATGPMGPQGPQGLQGAAGNDGAQGPAGLDGASGNDGATGPMGPQGPMGLAGAPGNDGATGPMGPQGPMGPMGLAGAPGNDGATGPMGPQGPAGPTGAQGPAGPQGPAGTSGVSAATAPLSIASNTIAINAGTAAGQLMTYNGSNWIAAAPAAQSFNLDNMQPYLTLNYLIATQGIFPSRNIADGEYIGAIGLFAGSFDVRGFAYCNGQIISIAQYTALFSILGTTYGGNGQTTFALPDLRGRTAIHFGQGPGLSNYNLGQTGGAERVIR